MQQFCKANNKFECLCQSVGTTKSDVSIGHEVTYMYTSIIMDPPTRTNNQLIVEFVIVYIVLLISFACFVVCMCKMCRKVRRIYQHVYFKMYPDAIRKRDSTVKLDGSYEKNDLDYSFADKDKHFMNSNCNPRYGKDRDWTDGDIHIE